MVAAPLRVLVVCTGNICRSPLAERLLQARLGRHAVVRSAGIRGLDAAPMDEHAAAELARRGGDPDGFRSRRLEPADVREADLVLTMTTAQRSEVLAEEPAALARTFTLRELAHLLDQRSVQADHPAPAAPADRAAPAAPAARYALDAAAIAELSRRRSAARLERYDIPDPIGRPPSVHAEVATEIDDAVATIAEHLRTG